MAALQHDHVLDSESAEDDHEQDFLVSNGALFISGVHKLGCFFVLYIYV